MPAYRCFLKTEAGRVASVEIIDAADDHEAKTKSLDLLRMRNGYRSIELWELNRLVDRYP